MGTGGVAFPLVKTAKNVGGSSVHNNTKVLVSKTSLHFNLYQGCEDTMVLARLIGQFVPILGGKTFNGVHFVLVRATEKIKTVLDQ